MREPEKEEEEEGNGGKSRKTLREGIVSQTIKNNEFFYGITVKGHH